MPSRKLCAIRRPPPMRPTARGELCRLRRLLHVSNRFCSSRNATNESSTRANVVDTPRPATRCNATASGSRSRSAAPRSSPMLKAVRMPNEDRRRRASSPPKRVENTGTTRSQIGKREVRPPLNDTSFAINGGGELSPGQTQHLRTNNKAADPYAARVANPWRISSH